MGLLFLLFYVHTFAFMEFHENPLDAIHPEHNIFSIDPNVHIDLSSYSFSGCNGQVQVNVSGVSSPNPYDYVALYLASENITNVVPIKYAHASISPGYVANGMATLNFELINLREDLIFYLFQNISGKGVVLQESSAVVFASYDEPCFGRLALTDNLNEMRVTWSTANTNTPFVKYGLVSGQYNFTASATTSTYTPSMLCGSPANSTGWRSPGQIHTAVLTNLLPNTKYYYQYGDSYGVSSENSFTSAPSVGPDASFRFIIMGDMGASDNDDSSQWLKTDSAAPSVADAVAKETDANLVLLIGDLSYADGYLSKWESFHSQVQSISSRSAFMVSQGNHDRDFPGTDTTYTGPDSGGECGVVIESQWPMPLVSSSEPWWSFNYGSIHFVVMNTEVNFTTGSAQYNWIENDLNHVNRQLTPYILFTGHRPMYCDSNENYTTRGGSGNLNVQAQLQLHIEPLLKKHKVPLAFWGHNHNYQRTCPVWNQTCGTGQSGTTHFVLGISGRALDGGNSLQVTKPTWINFLNYSTHGYIRATADEKQVNFEYVAVALTGETQVVDSFSFSKPNSATSRAPSLFLFLFLVFLIV